MPRSAFIVNAANPRLTRSRKATRKSETIKGINRRVTLANRATDSGVGTGDEDREYCTGQTFQTGSRWLSIPRCVSGLTRIRWLGQGVALGSAAKAIAAYVEFAVNTSAILLFIIVSRESCLGRLPHTHHAQKKGNKEHHEQPFTRCCSRKLCHKFGSKRSSLQ
jgi:hypothetical protein